MAASRVFIVVLIYHITGIPAKKNMLRSGAGGCNLSHNHQLVPQSTVVDGRTIVNMESSLSPEEFNSIKEQSYCRVNIPQMRVNLEEVFLDRSFSSSMLH